MLLRQTLKMCILQIKTGKYSQIRQCINVVRLEGFFSEFYVDLLFYNKKRKNIWEVLVFKKKNYVCFIVKLNLKKKKSKSKTVTQEKIPRLPSGKGGGGRNQKKLIKMVNFFNNVKT